MLEIQKYLQNNSPESLKQDLKIGFRPHKRYPNLLCFKYNQIDSPMDNRICQEARGITLDAEDNWKVVGRGFDKFFNYGEPNAVEIDWSTAKVQSKIDGSLIVVYPYRNQWEIATSGTADALGSVSNHHECSFLDTSIQKPETFREYFLNTARQYSDVFDREPQDGIIYFFELVGPFNRVVVRYQKPEFLYDKHRTIQSQKDFAINVKNCKIPGALFSLRNGKVNSIREFIAEMRLENLIKHLDL